MLCSASVLFGASTHLRPGEFHARWSQQLRAGCPLFPQLTSCTTVSGKMALLSTIVTVNFINAVW